ncbi:Uncharacterized protein conserved in bacteria [Proteus mirabilis]|uniref:Uncharacterized protein conserved in bacteria n=1 Tax=Proteus mirabilis TaxID=584 RepID=A0A379GIN0_PROMI|nr:Uncharacterized protein conserved in bacteria [Proteus mirabilis]
MADRYYHAPETSSLIEETDLVWTRPCTNIHILGVARPKGNQPTAQWRAGIRIENFSKNVVFVWPSLLGIPRGSMELE